MSGTARFKVMWPWDRTVVALLKRLGCPRWVPWALVAPHERRAERNHRQSLEQLNHRGGLDPCELLAVLEDRGLLSVVAANLETDARKLVVLLTEWTADNEETISERTL